MPTKKLRGTEGRNYPIRSLSSTMHLGDKQKIGTPHDSQDYLFRNIKKSNSRGSGKAPKTSKAGYDVKTRVNIPSAKGAGKRSRTQKKMRSA